jgi:RecA-family ATPase
VVGYLHGTGSTLAHVVELLEQHPNGVAQKYAGRLEEETRRVWDKLESQDADSEQEQLFDVKAPEVILPLQFEDLSQWDTRIIPGREWAVFNRLPLRVPVLFSGPGGGGKSTLGLQLGGATVLGREWLGTVLEAGPAVVIDCEDEYIEMVRRIGAVNAYYGVKFADVQRCGFCMLSWATDSDTILAVPGRRSGRLEPTKLFARLRQTAGDLKPRILVVASSANVFAGSEIDRAQVQQFMKMLAGLCHISGGTVVLISHPSVRGMDTGTGISGSTAWDSGVRARMYLRSVVPPANELPDDDLRDLEFAKVQYGRKGEVVRLRRHENGLYLPEAGTGPIDAATRDVAADQVFLLLLARFSTENRTVCHKKNAGNFAPREFAAQEEARSQRLNQDQLKAAMERLIKAGRVKIEPYGPPSKDNHRLVVVTEAAAA